MDRRGNGGCGFAFGLSGGHPAGRHYCNGRKGAILTPVFEEVALTGSTNADLLARVSSGVPEGLWLRADAQDGGRGRMGRQWVSASGNLFASTVVRLRPLDPASSSLGFVTALAVSDAVAQIAPEILTLIKWPNDLMAGNGAKLSGMLLERADDAVVVGVGLNLVDHPENIGRPATSLRALGANPPHPQAVAEILANAFGEWLGRWREGGLLPILRAWQNRAHPAGTALSVNLPSGEQFEGLYSGLTDEGALQLRLADGGIRAIHAADVFVI